MISSLEFDAAMVLHRLATSEDLPESCRVPALKELLGTKYVEDAVSILTGKGRCRPLTGRLNAMFKLFSTRAVPANKDAWLSAKGSDPSTFSIDAAALMRQWEALKPAVAEYVAEKLQLKPAAPSAPITEALREYATEAHVVWSRDTADEVEDWLRTQI